MAKGEHTRDLILDQALDLSSEVGLEGLTIGSLAKQVGMSKSGLYAHFTSKEALQVQVLDAAEERFVEAVLKPGFKHPRGLPRVRALFDYWLAWGTKELKGGCPFIAAATEFDDRSGPVRDRVFAQLSQVIDTIARSARVCVEEGHFHANLDCEQYAFEVWGILQSHHHFVRLLRRDGAASRARAAFERLLTSCKSEQ